MGKILVTGSSGFIGRALVSKLRALLHEVEEFDTGQGDVTTEGALDQFRDISHLFHLAGKTFVPESWSSPYGFYRVNLLGTVSVLEFCRKNRIPVTCVSSYIYGEPDYLPVDENHPVKSYNPYSHSKMLADQTCRFYAEQFGLPLTILRPFNAYGPGQPPVFIIPEIVSAVLDSSLDTVEVMDLRPKRDYIFIDDLVNALVLSMKGPPGIYNIGSGRSVSVGGIIRLVMEITGIRKEIRSAGNQRPNEIFDLYADISKAKRELGWSPETSFESGIRQCIDAATGRTRL